MESNNIGLKAGGFELFVVIRMRKQWIQALVPVAETELRTSWLTTMNEYTRILRPDPRLKWFSNPFVVT